MIRMIMMCLTTWKLTPGHRPRTWRRANTFSSLEKEKLTLNAVWIANSLQVTPCEELEVSFLEDIASGIAPAKHFVVAGIIKVLRPVSMDIYIRSLDLHKQLVCLCNLQCSIQPRKLLIFCPCTFHLPQGIEKSCDFCPTSELKRKYLTGHRQSFLVGSK